MVLVRGAEDVAFRGVSARRLRGSNFVPVGALLLKIGSREPMERTGVLVEERAEIQRELVSRASSQQII